MEIDKSMLKTAQVERINIFPLIPYLRECLQQNHTRTAIAPAVHIHKKYNKLQ